MIDSKTVAKALHEEARLFIQNMKFSPPESDLGFEKNWERATSEHPVPDIERLAQLIDSVFWASVSTEEGRPCRPRLTYAPANDSGLIVHRFEENVNLTRESLRGLH